MKKDDALLKALKDTLRNLELNRKQSLSDVKAYRRQAAGKAQSSLGAALAIDAIVHAEYSAGVAEGYRSAITQLRFDLKNH